MRVKERKVSGRNCVVVDNVSTTDATLMECKRVLKKIGTQQALLLTLAV